jgi:hypothetical protein
MERQNKLDKNSVSSISNILKIIQSAFNVNKKPLKPISPQLILTGGNLKTGLSPKQIAAKIISRQAEAGAPVGDLYSKSNNITEAMYAIMVEEIISAIMLNGKIEIVIPPGVEVITYGANSGGPVVSQGATTNVASGWGVIR